MSACWHRDRPLRTSTGNSKVVIDEGTMDIHWHQDPLRRVIEIRGEIDESFMSHLSRSVVDLGRRDLVIDLSGCTISVADYESLRHLEQRLGNRTLLVLSGNETAGRCAETSVSQSPVSDEESRVVTPQRPRGADGTCEVEP